uniref:Uncharacterized protein n=1 Tax=Anguilla anguilla TaxID=7936 RepID=A0A0E9TCH6_ANGAN
MPLQLAFLCISYLHFPTGRLWFYLFIVA